MKRMKRTLTMLLAALLVCASLAGYATAAEEEAMWLVVEEASEEVSAQVQTNAVVADGVIRVTFDPAKLIYTGCDFPEGYVAMNAVNDTKASEGELQIAWVAPAAVTLEDGTAMLFQVNFEKAPGFDGTVTASDFQVEGTANDPAGQAVPVEEAPTEPTQPTDPSEPTNPSEPTDPTETTNPSESTAPTETTETTGPAETVKPTDPNGPDQTGETANPVLAGMVLLISGLFLMGTVAYSRMRRGA